jgi:hypothetical protein
MQPNCVFFKFTCKCGQVAQVVRVGITDELKIIAQWKCMKCRKDVYQLKNIEDAISAAPPPPVNTEPKEIVFTDFDINLMGRAKVGLTDQTGENSSESR